MFGGIVIADLHPAKILMVAGEASGDLHGGNLAREILNCRPHLRIFGIGGPHMQGAGVQLLQNINDLAVVGIVEVLSHWKIIHRTFQILVKFIKEARPELVILIDYPDFNLRLAKIAKKTGSKILYYISPQVWAWRKGRIKTMAQNVNTLLVVFSFELAFYQNSGLDVRFIGHPLVDTVKPKFDKEEGYGQLRVDPKKPIIGLLPGSRRSEISHILPPLLGAAQRIAEHRPEVQFLLALAPTIPYALIEPHLKNLKKTLTIQCWSNHTYDIVNLSDLVLVSSGTATLETALLNTPMILVYKLSALSYILGRILIRVPYIGLVNLVAGKKIVPELIQGQANPKKIASLAEKILQNPKAREAMRQELREVKEKLGEEGSSKRGAQVVLEMLEQK